MGFVFWFFFMLLYEYPGTWCSNLPVGWLYGQCSNGIMLIIASFFPQCLSECVHVCDVGHFCGGQKTNLGELFFTFYFVGARTALCFPICFLLAYEFPALLSPPLSHGSLLWFAFSFSHGSCSLKLGVRILLLFAQPHPKLNCLNFLLAVVTFPSQLHCLWAGVDFHSEWRKENSLMERWESLCWWRWDMNPDVRGSVRLKVQSDLLSMIGLCRSFT